MDESFFIEAGRLCMKRKTKRKWPIVIASTAVIIVLFAALFLLGHPGAYDTYIQKAVNKLESFSGYFFKNDETKASNGSELLLHFIDVGQADCTLIECNKRFMLVDGGNNADAKAVVSYLKRQGVKTLDYVIGTHPHEDHVGGLDKVIETFDAEKLILPDIDYQSKTYQDVLKAASKNGTEIVKARAGETYDLSSDASFTIISPCEDYGEALNNWSVGIRISHGKNHVLMCGDAEAKAEADMLASGEPLSAQLLKVSHHGSSTSTTDAFLDVVNPKYAVIFCGQDNEYGHPHREILEKLEARAIDIFRTDVLGTVTAVSDGRDFVFGASGR